MVAIAAAAFVAIFFFDVPFPLIVLGGRADRLRRRPGRAARLRAPAAATALGEPAVRGRRDRARRGRPPRTPAPNARAGRCASSASACCSGSRRCMALAADARPRTTSSAQIAVFFSKMAVVTFGGAYAVLAYVAQQAVETYGWLAARRDARRPRHGRDHARPADHGRSSSSASWAPIRDPGALQPAGRRHARRRAHHLGDLRALLPLDLPRRPLRRGAARQPGARAGRSPRSPPRSSA